MAEQTGVSDLNTIISLLQGVQFEDPKLYRALMLIAKDIGLLLDDLAPIRQFVQVQSAPPSDVPDIRLGLNYEIHPTYLRLYWEPPPSSEIGKVWYPPFSYDIREGSNWDAAERVIITASQQVLLNPIAAGTTRYLIKTVDRLGNYSTNPVYADVLVSAPGAVTLSAQVIDNNVLLSWTQPTTQFAIAEYIVKKGGVEVGRASSTFTILVESVAATYTYSIVPVDLAGNQGTAASVTVEVKAPPDYTMISSITSAFAGTKTNCVLDNGKLLFCVDTAKTWATHFSSRSWADIQDQIDAGYPLFYQPALTSGSYQEVFDFGSVYQNCIVNVDWAFLVLVGSVSFTATIETSTDNINWSAPVVGRSVFVNSLRYVRLTINATGTDADLQYIYNLRVLLNVKQEVDSGNATANSGDSGGTIVNFNKTFKFVNSIVLTSVSGEPVNFVYQFDGGANPTHFHVYAYDSAGLRITKDFSWVVRGVV